MSAGKIVKNGISSEPLNKDGSSPRANSQVNAANRAKGWPQYLAEVTHPNIAGRLKAFAREGRDFIMQSKNDWMDLNARKPKGMRANGKNVGDKL